MLRFPCLCLLGLIALAGAASWSGAQSLDPLPLPAPPGGQLPAPPGFVPTPPPVAYPALPPAPCRPMTLCEFANTFQPTPGPHEVLLIHPCSHRCVKVCFTLPCGCVKVCAHKRELVFDCGCPHEVRIVFKLLCSKVRVDYR